MTDALSRRDADLELMAVSAWQFEGIEELEEEVQRDEKLRGILQQVVTRSGDTKGYHLRKRILLYEGRVVIPRASPRTEALIKEFHDSPMGGLSGYLCTYKRMAAIVYWAGMRKDIQDYVARCDTCRRNKYAAMNPAGLLMFVIFFILFTIIFVNFLYVD